MLFQFIFLFTSPRVGKKTTPPPCTKDIATLLHLRTLQVLIEPSNSLKESLFLGKLLLLLRNVAADSEAVLDVGEEVELVGHVVLEEDVLRLAAFFGGEDWVGFCSVVGGWNLLIMDGREGGRGYLAEG